MSKSERTRKYILERTAPVFNIKGFEGTSLSDLTEVTGLTKGALYGNFADKEEIGQAAFHYSMARVKEMVTDAMAGAVSYKDQLNALLGFYARYVFDPPVPGGCPLLNSAIEVDDNHTAMRPIVAVELMKTIDFMASLLRKGVRAGEFNTAIKPREIAYALFCSVEGALMFARVERSREPMDVVVKHCKTLLDQISK